MLRMREYEALEVDVVQEDLRALIALTREGRVLQSVTPTGTGRHIVVPGPYVGRLRLPSGLVLEIRSRFGLADLVVLLADYVGAPALIRPDQVPVGEDSGLIDLIGITFTAALERLVGRGLPKGYRERTFTRPPFAGRPDVATHLRRHAGRADRLVTKAQRITQDIAVNQVLATAHDQLLRAPLRHVATRAGLMSLTPAIATVSRPIDIDRAIRLARPRLPAHCREVFDLAVLVVRGVSLLPEGVDRDGAAVLFPMPKVWESHVERVIAAEAPSGHRIARQVAVPITDPPKRSTGYADVVEYDVEGRPLVVYDAKYKHLGRPTTDDLFQVFTYCSRLGCERAVLVLPGRGERSTVGMGRIVVEVRGLPVLTARPTISDHGLADRFSPVPVAPGEASNDELLDLERAERLL